MVSPDGQSLHILPCYAMGWSFRPEEFRVGHRRVVEGVVVVDGSIEVLSVGGILVVVVFGALNVKVRNPSEFTIKVTLTAHL